MFISVSPQNCHVLIGTQVQSTALLGDFKVAIFDDADQTITPKTMTLIGRLQQTCQIIGLSAAENTEWKSSLKSAFSLIIPVPDPFYQIIHRFVMCNNFEEKMAIIVAISADLRLRAMKAILFCVSVFNAHKSNYLFDNFKWKLNAKKQIYKL